MSQPKPYILFVDDDKDDRDLIKQCCRELSLAERARFVASGDALFDFLCKVTNIYHYPSLIVLDVNMPGISGKDTLLRLRRDPRYKQIPLVMLSTSSRYPEHYIALGADAFYTKPLPTVEKRGGCPLPTLVCLAPKQSVIYGGVRPVPNGHPVRFESISLLCEPTYSTLRRYLDIVFTYAETISLAKELRPVSELSVGTVIIRPGSPGHCSIVVDEAVTSTGEKVFKLAKGFTPAQSIYILRNPYEAKMGAWQSIVLDGSFQTASYYFSSYKLGTFD